ncbi:hypothetical protein C8R45DRAFT_1153388 [Mycena sanguinolenta]|nr:hypothetical protein C8R45DRAFT_1153388 [Mycena sanguinolenta]
MPRTRALAALEQQAAPLDGIKTYQERIKIEAAGRSIGSLTTYTARSPVSTELTKERVAAQESALKTNSTPVKSGGATDLGINVLTRAHVEIQLAQEIHARRSKSGDLVEFCFGSIINVELAADILREFVGMKILTVRENVGGKWKNVPKNRRRTVCTAAGIQAKQAVSPSNPSPTDLYQWTWNLPLEASEASAALFLNVISIAAHAAAIRSGQEKRLPLPSLRFIPLSDPHHPVPLSNEAASQDCRPDVVALVNFAFCQEKDITALSHRFVLPASPFEYIRQHFPAILDFSAAHRATKGTAVAFMAWFEEQERRNCLDLSRFCWPELQLTAEAKMNDKYNAVLQELVYMRQHRRTQPWMQSILGLVMTTEVMGLIRADTLGLEECLFERSSSRGVIDGIRVCLGLVSSSHVQRGQHEAFKLGHTKTQGPPHLKPPKALKASKANIFAKTEPVAEVTVEYSHRILRFIRLHGRNIHHSPDGTRPEVTYYVHHLVQNNSSLVGRCSRIFCVSRETTESEEHIRRFIGPYALKVYHADHASDCYREVLIGAARHAQVQNVLLPTWEWRYGDALSARGFSSDVVGKYAAPQPTRVVPGVESNRQEIFAQSDLKRLLAQSSGYPEFAQAFIDFAEGIASLTEHKLGHRDLSIGNVLLSRDVACSKAFFSDAVASASELLGARVVFEQRPLERRNGGLLHDMDMAGPVHQPPAGGVRGLNARVFKTSNTPAQPTPQPLQLQKGFRTGTPPFMAIGLLLYGPPHFVAYDLHSLFFVMALFFWSYPAFVDTPFPNPVPAKQRAWPKDVLRWANRPDQFSLADLGLTKRFFFSQPERLQKSLQSTLSEDPWVKDMRYVTLFWAFYGVLWKEIADSEEWSDRCDVTPTELVTALKKAHLKNAHDVEAAASED